LLEAERGGGVPQTVGDQVQEWGGMLGAGREVSVAWIDIWLWGLGGIAGGELGFKGRVRFQALDQGGPRVWVLLSRSHIRKLEAASDRGDVGTGLFREKKGVPGAVGGGR